MSGFNPLKAAVSFATGGLSDIAGAAIKGMMPKAPDLQQISTTAPPPVIEDTQAKQQELADMLRRRKGRAASILTAGKAEAPVTASKVLLGQ